MMSENLDVREMDTLFKNYDYYTWTIKDPIPHVEIGDKIAVKPHSGGGIIPSILIIE